ncbi:MAG TPA: hypothetical protein VGX23_04250 [Actinocrinis sp.]|nr:hypothetical protein [Actinocrinis sp.]
MRHSVVGAGPGFQVDPAGLAGMAGRVGRAYDDFGGAVVGFREGGGSFPSAFGEFGVGDAWTSFNAAWSSELDVTRSALAELIRKVSTTAQRYEEAEATVIASVHQAGAP